MERQSDVCDGVNALRIYSYILGVTGEEAGVESLYLRIKEALIHIYCARV